MRGSARIHTPASNLGGRERVPSVAGCTTINGKMGRSGGDGTVGDEVFAFTLPPPTAVVEAAGGDWIETSSARDADTAPAS